MKYYSQLGQDSIAKQFFDRKGVVTGTFLDCGALDGKNFSNTFLLEQNGWTGICIEAHPDYYSYLKSSRPKSKCYSCAVGDDNKSEVHFKADAAGCFSTLNFKAKFLDKRKQLGNGKEVIEGFANGEIKVPMRTIDSILSENNITEIDFISIDIDGSEKYALPHFNISAINWTLFCIEYAIVPDAIDEFQKKHNLKYYRDLKWDRIFVKTKDDLDLLNGINVKGEQSITKHPMSDWKTLKA